VKKVEDIQDQKRTSENLKDEEKTKPAKASESLKDLERAQKISELKTFIQSSNFLSKLIGTETGKKIPSTPFPDVLKFSDDNQASRTLEEIRDLKNDQRFNELKNLIQTQNSLSSLIKSETSGLRDILQSSTESSPETKVTKDMIKALSKLNEISSLLLKENDETKSTVRELPDEIKNILQSEMDELRSILEDQNTAVSRQLQESLSTVHGHSSINSETEIVILKALAQFNKIAGVLLKEQEKTEKQAETALKALPALAKFIQEETSDIKGLIENQENQGIDLELEELKKSVQQSLANDKLITKAIIKLNDITQLLLRDVNFTTAAVTNKLPAALTALITSETSKIKDMIESQNAALVDIIKETETLSKAEKVTEEVKKMKVVLNGDSIKSSKLAEEKILEIVAPILNSTEIKKDTRNVILDFLAPLLVSLQKDNEEEKLKVKNISKTAEERVLDALFPLLKDEEQEVGEKKEILRLVSSLISTEKSTVLSETVIIKNETIPSKVEEDEPNKGQQVDQEKDEFLKAQLSGQKSIVQALLKLTNITRTLLEEKELSKKSPEVNVAEVSASKEVKDDFIEVADEKIKEEVRSSGKKSKRKEIEEVDEDYDLDDELDSSAPGRKKTLVERIATGSSASRNLKGNQALFEEFVKLAIERQRWEQAAQVHSIIQSTLTTLPPLRSSHKKNKEEDDIFESEEDIEEEPRNSESNARSNSQKKASPKAEIEAKENIDKEPRSFESNFKSNTEESRDSDETTKATEKLPKAKTTKRPQTTSTTKKTTLPTTTTTTTEEPEELEYEEEILEETEGAENEEQPEEKTIEEEPKEIRGEAEKVDNNKLQSARTSLANRINSRNRPSFTSKPNIPNPTIQDEKSISLPVNTIKIQDGNPESETVQGSNHLPNETALHVIKPTAKPAETVQGSNHLPNETVLHVIKPTAKPAVIAPEEQPTESLGSEDHKHSELIHGEAVQNDVIIPDEIKEFEGQDKTHNMTNESQLSQKQKLDGKSNSDEAELETNDKEKSSAEPIRQQETLLRQQKFNGTKSRVDELASAKSLGGDRAGFSTSRSIPLVKDKERNEHDGQPKHFNGPGRGRGFFRPRTTTSSHIVPFLPPTDEVTEKNLEIAPLVSTVSSELIPVVLPESSTSSTTSDPLKLLQSLVDHRVKNQPGEPSDLSTGKQGIFQQLFLFNLMVLSDLMG